MGMIRLLTVSAAKARWMAAILSFALACSASEKAERLLAIMPSGESF
jgi:hypothetical protein